MPQDRGERINIGPVLNPRLSRSTAQALPLASRSLADLRN
jgi:hypothetical protein